MSNFTFRLGETDDGKAVLMDLPTLIETRLFDLASSGGGKSYALRVLIEKTAGHVQWIVIDPEGEFSSLREKFDFLLVGKEGEVPVDEHSAKLLARKIMQTRVSTIVDLYEYKDIRKPWAADFLDELMTLPKNLWSPVMVALDEAHQFAPESVKGNANEPPARVRRAVITLSDSGRKQSRGCVIATQRLSKLAADARAELRNNLIGLTVQDIDRDRAADILGIPKRDNSILRELDAGEFFAFGPAFVSHKGVFRMKIDKAITRHPKPGEGRLLAVPKASDAIQIVVSEMGDLPAQAQEETREIETLRRDNARLQHELKARPVQVQMSAPEVKIVEIEKPILNGELPRLEAIFGRAPEVIEPVARVGDQLVAWGNELNTTLREVRDAINKFQTRPPTPMPTPARQMVSVSQPLTPGPLKIERVTDTPITPVVSEGLTNPQQRILDALAQFEQLGLTMPHKSNVAVFADASPKSSGFQNNMGRLRTLNYVEYSGNGRVSLTDFGRALANPAQPIRTLADLHQAWYARLSRPQAKILEQVIAAYPHAVGKNELAERAGQSATSSGYQNNLGALRSLGLVDYPRAGYIVATTLLFPDGLR